MSKQRIIRAEKHRIRMHSPVREVTEMQRQDAAKIFWQWVDAGKKKEGAHRYGKIRNIGTLSPGLANIVLLVLNMQQKRKDAAERRAMAQHGLLLAEEAITPEDLETQATGLEREAEEIGKRIESLMSALSRSLQKDDFGFFFHSVVSEVLRPDSGRSKSEAGLITE